MVNDFPNKKIVSRGTTHHHESIKKIVNRPSSILDFTQQQAITGFPFAVVGFTPLNDIAADNRFKHRKD